VQHDFNWGDTKRRAERKKRRVAEAAEREAAEQANDTTRLPEAK
jgi:hypothetical protein